MRLKTFFTKHPKKLRGKGNYCQCRNLLFFPCVRKLPSGCSPCVSSLCVSFKGSPISLWGSLAAKIFYCPTFFEEKQVRVLHQGGINQGERPSIWKNLSRIRFWRWMQAGVNVASSGSLKVQVGKRICHHWHTWDTSRVTRWSTTSGLLYRLTEPLNLALNEALILNYHVPGPTTMAPTHSLSGRDSVTLLDETKSSLTDTVGVAGTSEVATPNYSTGSWQVPVW